MRPVRIRLVAGACLMLAAAFPAPAQESPEAPRDSRGGAAEEDDGFIIESHDVQEDWDGERRRREKARKAAEPAPSESAPARAAVGAEAKAPGNPERPRLLILPWTEPKGARGDSAALEKAAAGVRLGFAQSGLFRPWTEEEAARSRSGWNPRRKCFSRTCVEKAARESAGDHVLASQYHLRDGLLTVKLVLADPGTGSVRSALRAWGSPGDSGIISFSRDAAARLASGSVPAAEGAGFRIDPGPWKDIPWLNPEDSADARRQWRWAGSGLLLAGLGLAWAQGQLLQEDGNGRAPSRDVLPGGGRQSFLRGFFAAPDLGARYAAMGGAGIAQVDNGLALLMNPAGVAETDRGNALAAKRTLPGGAPSFFLGYAGPLYRGWGQGLGIQYEGDHLAGETTLHGALASGLGGLGDAWEGVTAGSQAKIYLAQVGRGGTGLERSTGHSFGMGLDFGIRARLNDRITAALAVRDAVGFLRHANTLTNRTYGEILPPEYRVGAAYRASPGLLLLMDGQKGLLADQADHLRLGGEKTIFGILALRAGLHEIFGREAVRKMTLGFGLDTDGLGKALSGSRVSLNYGFEFGLDEDAPLAGGQQFSLEAGF